MFVMTPHLKKIYSQITKKINIYSAPNVVILKMN